MLREYDRVKLRDGDEQHGVEPGEEGTIILVAKSQKGEIGYLVEFWDYENEVNKTEQFYTEDKLEFVRHLNV